MPVTTRIAALAASTVAMCLISAPARGEGCATWRAATSQGALPMNPGASSKLARWNAQASMSAGSGMGQRVSQIETFVDFFGTLREIVSIDRCGMAVGLRSWLLQLALSQPEWVKPMATNPRAISDQYKVFDGAGRLRAMSIGWIPRTLPSQYVVQDGDTTVLRFPLRDLTENRVYPWTEYSVLALKSEVQGSAAPNVNAMVEFMASADASVLMGDYFWVVPNNSTLRRRLRIEIVDDDRKVLASSPCTSTECYPQPSAAQSVTLRANGQTYDVCTTASRTRGPDIASACPQISSAKAQVTDQGTRTLRLPIR